MMKGGEKKVLQIEKKIITVLIVVIGLFTTICFAFDNNDFQYWNTESISWKISDDWKAQLETEFRYGDNASDFYYQHSDIGLTYSGAAKWLDFGFNYRQIFEEKNSIWQYENVPHFNATLKWELLDYLFSNRMRFEYKNKEGSDNYWRYRNKITVKIPIKLTNLEIQPYIADEIFYDFDEEIFNKNRLYAGFNFRLFKHLKVETFYLWQNSKNSSGWSDICALGAKLKLFF
ncbi:MAG: DUF2490 domain-containing protein [Candidatus Kaelpia aquatica]|nr:DUF2490 domain-containing protein [Candidatus Kaelpia aquatica]